MRKTLDKIFLILGILLLILTLLSVIGNLRSGTPLPALDFSSLTTFIYSLSSFIGFYGFGILGIVFILISIWLPSTKKAAKSIAQNAEQELSDKGMLICSECGATVKSSALFCPKCNTKINK